MLEDTLRRVFSKPRSPDEPAYSVERESRPSETKSSSPLSTAESLSELQTEVSKKVDGWIRSKNQEKEEGDAAETESPVNTGWFATLVGTLGAWSAAGIFLLLKLAITAVIVLIAIEWLPTFVQTQLEGYFTVEKLRKIYPALAAGGVIAAITRAEKSLQVVIAYFDDWKTSFKKTVFYAVRLFAAATVIILTGLALDRGVDLRSKPSVDFVIASPRVSLLPSERGLFSFYTFFTNEKFAPQLAGWNSLLVPEHGSIEIKGEPYDDMYSELARLLKDCSSGGDGAVVEVRGFASMSQWWNREKDEPVDRAFVENWLKPDERLLFIEDLNVPAKFQSVRERYPTDYDVRIDNAIQTADQIESYVTSNRAENFADAFNLWVAEQRASSAYCKLAGELEKGKPCDSGSDLFANVELRNLTASADYTMASLLADMPAGAVSGHDGAPDLHVFARTAEINVISAGRCAPSSTP